MSDRRQKELFWALWSTLFLAAIVVGCVRLATHTSAPLFLPVMAGLGGVAFLAHRGRLRWATYALAFLMVSTGIGMTFLAGELIPILHGLAVIPLFATFVSGTRAGVVWFLLSLAILGLTVLGVATLPLPAPSGRAMPAVSIMVVMTLVFAVTHAFERTRRSAINALDRRTNDAQTFFRLLPDDVLRVDRDGSVLQRSSPETLPNEQLQSLFLTEAVQRATSDALSSNKEQEVVEHHAGRMLSVRLIPVDEDELLALVRDRSDAQKLEERVTKAELIASLERANRMSSIGVLAACIAHEVNNPLAYLAGNLTFLHECAKRSAPMDEEHQGALEDAMNATERVRSIVAELKHYSREDKETKKTLRPSKVVDEALKIVRNEVRHIAEVTTDYDHGRARVAAEPTRIVQVIVNLLLNAAQALPAEQKHKNTIAVRTSYADDEVSLSVIDNGPGIPEELLARVTQPFFTTKAPAVGTGLGLAVCEEIVRQANGVLLIENNASGGATITVRLPVAHSAISSGELPFVAPAPVTQRARVLVIDDEPLVRRALTRLLREHEVVEADSGERAFELIKDERNFDVVLCDVMMPVLSGLDVYARLREDFSPLDERVVFMTGGAFDPRLQNLMQLAANVPVLDKPFDPVDLRRAVQEALERRPG